MSRRNAIHYDDDFFAWTQEQAKLLRAGELGGIDLENVAEEIESLGKSDRRQVANRLTVLLAHLLKWQLQPEERSRSWEATMFEQRRRLGQVLDDSPSLRRWLPSALPRAYADACEQASNETGLPVSSFPDQCPFTVEEVLAREFKPGSDA